MTARGYWIGTASTWAPVEPCGSTLAWRSSRVSSLSSSAKPLTELGNLGGNLLSCFALSLGKALGFEGSCVLKRSTPLRTCFVQVFSWFCRLLVDDFALALSGLPHQVRPLGHRVEGSATRALVLHKARCSQNLCHTSLLAVSTTHRRLSSPLSKLPPGSSLASPLARHLENEGSRAPLGSFASNLLSPLPAS
jgi:hypothetical protein